MDENYLTYLKGGMSFLKKADQAYEFADLELKRAIVGSMFPEKMIFENSRLRTLRLNEVVELILLEENTLEEIKKGLTQCSESQSRLAVRRGTEKVNFSL